MRKLFTIVLALGVLPMLGCSPLENQARDAAAALSGSIRSSNQVPGELHGEALTGNLPGHQSGSLRRERSDYGSRDLLWMGGDTGSS